MTDLDINKIKPITLNRETLIISNDMAKNINNKGDEGIIGISSMEMRINSNNPNKLEKEISQFVNPNKIFINNYVKQKQDEERLSMLISIFLYGLLLVVSLIGITNIYNTITASINLRKKEFEILRAVGMSNKQFNKMFLLESLLYGIKSLIMGSVLGTTLNYCVYSMIRGSQTINYYFPAIQMGIMIILTTMIIYISIKWAWKKLNKTK